MKVICIDDSNNEKGFDDYSGSWWVKVGNYYTVVKETIGVYEDGRQELCYELLEDPDHEDYAWPQRKFASVSSIDETEMIREYQTEKA